MKLPETYITDAEDMIVACWIRSFDRIQTTSHKKLINVDNKIPVSVRGMTERKVIHLCEKQKRDFYYIDTGYMGNLHKRKDFHRVVKNNVQNMKPRYDLPEDRFDRLPHADDFWRFKGWKKMDGPILVVTPSDKPCNFYGIDRDRWVYDTVAKIRKHTDREIIVRDKGLRRQRLGDNSVPAQLVRDNIHGLVTYNSIAAT